MGDTPDTNVRDLKVTVMEALLALSQREEEARSEEQVLLADQIYDMRGKLTDAAAILATGVLRNEARLPKTVETANGALSRMDRLSSTLPAAAALLLALDEMTPHPRPEPGPEKGPETAPTEETNDEPTRGSGNVPPDS